MTRKQTEMAQILQAAMEMAHQVRQRLPEPDGFMSTPGVKESAIALVASLLAFTPGRIMALDLIQTRFPHWNPLIPNAVITFPIVFLSVQYARFTSALYACKSYLDVMHDENTSTDLIETVCQDPSTLSLLEQQHHEQHHAQLFESDIMLSIQDDERYWDPRKQTLQALHRALRVCQERRNPVIKDEPKNDTPENDYPEERFDFQPQDTS